jgi:RimJ/RimL family protein N-acetyltransferase
MKDFSVNLTADKYLLKLIRVDDIKDYFDAGFLIPDKEVDYYTGTTQEITYDQVKDYVEKIENDETRYDFLIIDENEIIGEVVVNEIENSVGHFRMALFSSNNFGKGIGYSTSKEVIRYMFEVVGLSSIELEVFPFNERGRKVYEKLGFISVGTFIDDEANDPYRKYIKMILKKNNIN